MKYFIHGHAIVSADDRIADAAGKVPRVLRNPADWARFQAALDGAAVTVLGRRGHLANANLNGRNRLILSSDARGIGQRADGWWWNPAGASLDQALAAAAPAGGTVAVVGGRRVFDLFLASGYDRFDLARAPGTIPLGIPVFSAIFAGRKAEDLLAESGLVPGPTEMLDPQVGVSLVVWTRRPADGAN